MPLPFSTAQLPFLFFSVPSQLQTILFMGVDNQLPTPSIPALKYGCLEDEQSQDVDSLLFPNPDRKRVLCWIRSFLMTLMSYEISISSSFWRT